MSAQLTRMAKIKQVSRLSGKAQITLKIIKGMSQDDLDDLIKDGSDAKAIKDGSDAKACAYALENYAKIIRQIARRVERMKSFVKKKL